MASCPFCDSKDIVEESFPPYPHEMHESVTVYEKAIKCNKCGVGTMCRGTQLINTSNTNDKSWSIETISKKLIKNTVSH